MAKRACDSAGVKKRIAGVSLFESEEQRKKIEDFGIEAIHGDLLDMNFIRKLPAFKNVFFLAGMKFGSVDNLALTWAVNSLLPALVADHFKQSRIVAFNGLCLPARSGRIGRIGRDRHAWTCGEYAQSCLGRERMFEYSSKLYKTPVTLIRLNYSVELRYGVLVDIALKVKNKEPVDLTMGHFNVLWQGDVNDFVLRSLDFVSSPPRVLNITGPEKLSVKDVAMKFGKLFETSVRFTGRNLLQPAEQFRYGIQPAGKPEVGIDMVIQWIGLDTGEW
jgi:nucleoside-diphosphate-sugar epimerase